MGVDPHKTQSFMGYTATLIADRDRFLRSLDQYPFHFVMHLMHAAEILGYKHPDQNRRVFWINLYCTIVYEHLHCEVESMEMMDLRLADR
jgi:hypothetical protein